MALIKLNGQKIFITSGDHDLTENIIHLVLARATDSPQKELKALVYFCSKIYC